MKKVLVISEFYDKYDHSVLYAPGALVEFEDSRADNIVSIGLGQYAAEPQPAPAPDIKDEELTEPAPEDKPKSKKKK